ncbi:MAG TPA: HAMP domain-containing sensor histidine kinase, partial [Acidimicrobiia bacterium]|nr:HAMP domain-containing sensor histidine kinase [Acidimicrobiia bacterium]
MPRSRRSLSQRLVLALVGLSVGSVLLAGLITVVAARPATRSTAVSELKRGLDVLYQADRDGERPRFTVARLKAQLLADQVAVAAVLPDNTLALPGQGLPRTGATGRLLDRFRARLGPTGGGALLTKLPNGVRPADLDPAALAAGRVESGSRGPIVWVAQPLTPTAEGTLVLVATRRIGFFALGRLGGILAVAALIAAAVATAVSLWLVRRLTRPLEAIERTARAIAGGDLDARVGSGADVDDELAAVGAAIDTMAAELGRHRSLERAFLMSISHDLRTPLTSIRGYAEAVAEGAADDEESRRRAATIIEAEARRLERLVADLLELARLDAREFSLHPGPVDAAGVARHAALALEPAAREAGLRLVVAGEPGPLMAVADPERLAQVVANLVENALKYATATVEVASRAVPDGTVEIGVADDGPGIDPEDLPRVFERLYTSRRHPGRKVGTGLGLAIVRELVSAMGGRVGVDRTPDGGTRFVVSLAAAPPDGSFSDGPPGGSTSWRTTS